jgi:DNA-binding transcriptional LysR family regulator
MDRFESMSTLLAAVEAGSLSAASRRLGVPLATVSRRVSELETHLRARLVTRTSRRLELTDAGRSYVAACKRILDDIAEAERTASGEYATPRGDLTVTAPILMGRLVALPVVVDFLRAYPDINVRLVLTDGVTNLLQDRIDLALRIGELPDSSQIARRIGQIRRVVCASPDYFARRGAPKTPADLAAHDCITFEGLHATDAWPFPVGKGVFAAPIRTKLGVTTAEAAVDAAVAGVGVTRLLCYQMAEALRAGKLALALRDFEPPYAPVSLVYPAQPLLPLKLRAFLDFAAPRLKARLDELSV